METVARSFRLGGKEYTLSKDDVERSLKGKAPKPIEKYYVVINNERYTPKQALSAALGLPLMKFTTMDANRVLANLGFDITPVDSASASVRTISERLFEQYLMTNGLYHAAYETCCDSAMHRPDFTLTHNGRTILFEVKQFQATPDDFTPGFAYYDPYRPIREKINAARKQFHEYKELCCCLVLFNDDKPLVDLSPEFVYGAMLGNLGINIPLDVGAARAGKPTAQPVFTTGGSMHRYQGSEPTAAQNTTISSIIVLQHLRVGYRRFQAEISRIQRSRGHNMRFQELHERMSQAHGTDRDPRIVQLRTIVHDNPYTPSERLLPDDIFRGPYDERYGSVNGNLKRIYAGLALQRLEDEERPAWERAEDEILRHFYNLGPGDWHPTSLIQLGQVVTTTNNQELVMILRRLQDIAHAIQLRKWINTGAGWQTRLFLGDADVGAFFYSETGEGNEFQVKLTPQALNYVT